MAIGSLHSSPSGGQGEFRELRHRYMKALNKILQPDGVDRYITKMSASAWHIEVEGVSLPATKTRHGARERVRRQVDAWGERVAQLEAACASSP